MSGLAQLKYSIDSMPSYANANANANAILRRASS